MLKVASDGTASHDDGRSGGNLMTDRELRMGIDATDGRENGRKIHTIDQLGQLCIAPEYQMIPAMGVFEVGCVLATETSMNKSGTTDIISGHPNHIHGHNETTEITATALNWPYHGNGHATYQLPIDNSYFEGGWSYQLPNQSEARAASDAMDCLDLSMPVKLPDAIWYPALDDFHGYPEHYLPPSFDPQRGWLHHYGGPGVGQFVDFFGTAGLPGGEEGVGGSAPPAPHVKPTDIISPDFFEALYQQPQFTNPAHFNAFGNAPGTVNLVENSKFDHASITAMGSGIGKKVRRAQCPAYEQNCFSFNTTVKMSPSGLGKTPTCINGVPTVIGEDGKIYQKPLLSYAALISQALRECEGHKLTLSGIYDWIKDRFPYYRTAEAAWQNISDTTCPLTSASKKFLVLVMNQEKAAFGHSMMNTLSSKR